MIKESLSDALLAYTFLKAIVQPFKDMEVYKLGMIDEKGKLIRKPKTDKEKKAFGVMTRLVLNIKRILNKVIGGSKASKVILTAYLLREAYTQQESEAITETISQHYFLPLLEDVEEEIEDIDSFLEENTISEEELFGVSND